MTGPSGTLVEGIDREWLEEVAKEDPVGHAYALWDLQTAPDRLRFVTVRIDGRPRAYLLIWYGHPFGPIVHWVGSGQSTLLLTDALPERPLVAIVPEDVADAVVTSRAPADRVPLLVLTRSSAAVPVVPQEQAVRRLVAADADAVAALFQGRSELVLEAYRSRPPGQEPAWGFFSGNRLLGLVRAAVHLPRVWVFGGVFIVPEARGQGIGTALLASATRAAVEGGARPTLALREDNVPARRAYERIGYSLREKRWWIDAGMGLVP